MICAVATCDRESVARGWCPLHYGRWKKHGDPQESRPIRAMRMGLSIREKLERGLPDPLPSSDSCWDWRGTRSHYGIISHKYKNYYAHRVSWELANNSKIPKGMVIRHSCDNKFCVNPDHLSIGTQADNARDAVERGLHAHGERHGCSSLTTDDVVKIKKLLRDGVSHSQIADNFPCVTTSAIEAISSGNRWKHVAI